MEPRIQYAQTKDGVSIAFWTLGEGAPLIEMPPIPISHIQMEWQIPVFRRWYERLAENRKLIRYDSRGSGLSERNVTDYSLDSLVLDVEAVIDRLGLEKFSLFPVYQSGPVAIAYAARHPDRVSHLLLWHCWARTLDIASSQTRGLRRLYEVDWELYSETMAHDVWGWSEGEPARRYAAVIRESVAQEAAQAIFAASREFDVSALLPQVKSPTLVLHRRQTSFPQIDVVRGLVSGLSNARLALLEGASGAPFLGDMESVLQAIDEFLGEGEDAAAEPPSAGSVHTILFTDMESSTAITQRLGDAKAQELVRTHNSIVREALKTHDGTEIKHTGDGIMASFLSASGALECAVAIQRAVALRQAQGGQAEPVEASLRVRIGLNAGEPIAEKQDLFGTAVQLARRICDRAEAGQIVASNVVRELAAGKGFLFSDLGDVVPKGFEDPVRLYEVRWREED